MASHRSSDHELWTSILHNDHAAFSIFFDRHWSRVYTTIFHYLHDREAAAEVTHDIFLNLWLKRAQLNILSFSAYLQAAARYHVYKRQKAARSLPVIYKEQLEELEQHTCSNQGEEQLRYRELESNVHEYLNALPKRCREVYLLSRQQHLTNEQIAGKLGISKRTVENQLTHALQHLRGRLKKISIGMLVWVLFSSFN